MRNIKDCYEYVEFRSKLKNYDFTFNPDKMDDDFFLYVSVGQLIYHKKTLLFIQNRNKSILSNITRIGIRRIKPNKDVKYQS